MGDRKVLQKFQAFDTDAFEAVLGTDFFAQNEWIKYLSLQEPTHLLVVNEEQEWEAIPLKETKCPSGPLPPPGSVKKLVTMDLELREEFLKDRVRCRPYPASKDDMAEITRQIKECVEAGLVYEYKKTDYPKHCSPCFLVAKPGSTAKRLVVDYKKVNQKIKLHSGSLPLMENTVETAAGCTYKTKMDKRSGFWQIDLRECAQDLTAFIAPDGRVHKWRVMQFGIANAPALFQELMNQIIALCKRRPAVQELLQRGAVLEAHIDDVILGTNTIDDHLLLLREFYTVCQENHLRIKQEKCEFLKTETDYLGFHIGDGWWKPQDHKMKPPDGLQPNGFYV